LDRDKFAKSLSGRLARAGEGTGVYWAYVPNGLPPSLQLTDRLWLASSQAAAAVGQLAGIGRTLQNPHLFVRPFMRREAVLSSWIEGTQADLRELMVYEAGQLSLPDSEPPSAGAGDVREVLNYVKALEYGLARLETLPVSRRLIKELHEHLVSGVRGQYGTPGEFRTSPNWIGRPGCTLDEATFVPPPVPEMTELLSDFERYLHAENGYPQLVRLGLIHYQFEAIHPFIDGNGRIGRLLLVLLACHWKLLPLPLLYLSAYFEMHRDRYYDLLLGVSQRGAWEPWLLFFLEGVVEQARDAVERAEKLQDLQLDYRTRVTGKRSSALLPRLVDELFASPILTVRQAQRLLGVGHYQSAQYSIDKLVKAGILKQAPWGGRPRMFIAEEILAIIS
jgi:Fic family protein